MKTHVLVVGDLITDDYRICTSTRLCPEAPVPVLREDKRFTKDGGAGLVVAQLRELIGHDNVTAVYGSSSRKERVFADGRLLCRIDDDSFSIYPREGFYHRIVEEIQGVDLVIISDYGKGAMDGNAADHVMLGAKHLQIPVLVDAKHHWNWYPGAYAIFPNRHETPTVMVGTHLIQKLGEHGCEVNGFHIPAEHDHDVKDVTGAGDIFIAAFAAKMLQYPAAWYAPHFSMMLNKCAHYANIVAGKSVEHLGTYIVPSGLTPD